MSKRNHASVFPSDNGSSKRRVIAPVAEDEEAVMVLQNHASGLLECLEELKSGSGSLQKLQSISQSVLPAIQRLAQLGGPEQSGGRAQGTSHQALETSSPASKPKSPPVPSHFSLPPFRLEDIPATLPPLPPIRDPSLEAAVFTHPGISGRFGPNYERLEWLGDAYSEVISTSLLYTTFTSLDPGKLSQLRELLVKNATLGALAKQYKLVERARIPDDVKASKERMKKVPGDLMEAYMAAVILDDPVQGLQRLGEWSRSVFSMTIKEQIKSHERNANRGATAPQAPNETPKEILQKLLGAPGIKLRYEDDPSGPKYDKHHKNLPVFSINLYLDGWGETNKWLGRGTDMSKKEAGQKAAQMALNSKALIKKYAEKKRAYQAAQEQQ